MSTATKLTYLNETKTLLKNKINLTGANITTDTFRQYPTKLQNALLDVWNNEGEPIFTNWGTKVNGEGTNVNLDNTINARMKLTPKGNTSQIQYSGKNLFDKTSNIVLDKYIGGDGTIQNEALNWYQEDYIEVKPSTNYIMSSNSSQTVRIALYDENKTFISRVYSTGNIQTTTTATTKYVRLSGYNNVNNNIMLEKGSTATTYEPYVGGTPSPNPNYPQNVNVVSGDNEIDIVGKNLFEQEYILSPNDNNKNAHLKAGTYTLTTCDSNNFGTNVYFKLFNSSGSAITTNGHLTSTNVEINFSTSSYNYYGGGGSSHITFTIDNDYTIAIGLLNADGTRQVMLTKGTAPVSTYEPYTSQNYPLYLGVENLWNNSQVETYSDYVIPLETGFRIYKTANGRISPQYDISLNVGETYTISCNLTKTASASKLNCEWFTSDGDILWQPNIGDGETTITPSKNVVGVAFYLTQTEENGKYFEITNLQITKGTSPQHISTTPIELNKIGTYQDYIYKDSGKWYLHKEVGKVVLNGSESWSYEGGRFVVNFLINALNTSGRQQALSNYFNYVASGSASYGIFIYKASDTNYQIYIYDSDYTTANDFKTWLSTHNTNVYYVLNTPTEEEITNTTLINQLETLKGAMSYEGQTNISSGFMIVGASALGELN